MPNSFHLTGFASFFFGFIALLTLSTATARASEKAVPYSYKTVANDPLKTRIYTLRNGLTVYMTVYKDEPRIQTYIAVKAGSKYDPSDATGLAHYLEHLLFKGTDKFGTTHATKEKAEIDKVIGLYETYRATKDTLERKNIYHQIDSISSVASRYAIANEYDKLVGAIGAKATNAYTWVEQTVYKNDIPTNQLEKWLTIEAERFRSPVMRLFHTELEVVYEEKNRMMDSDDSKLWEALYAGLFPAHPYGTQTTIGTVEHLKNPSIQKVIDYYNTYYVPNNMAVCLSGDFDPDEAIKLIDAKFGQWQPKPVPAFKSPVEAPIIKPVEKTVLGPDAEDLVIAYRFGGADSHDADMITLINKILYNNTAGLLDLNLNQSQKVLGANSFTTLMKDYSAHMLSAQPREGQSLEEVKSLLLEQIEFLKAGKFPDWLLKAAINDLKLEQIEEFENNSSRAHAFVDAFAWDMPWQNYTEQLDRLTKITKQDIVRFSREHYGNNYVAIYKRTGTDTTAQKVEKPPITPVSVNRDSVSAFVQTILKEKSPEIQPVFLDFQKDIESFKIKSNRGGTSIPVFYKQNTENQRFELYYLFDMGTNHDKRLAVALDYLEYLGTHRYSPSQLKEEFYKIGCTVSVHSTEDRVYVSLSGLAENFEKAVGLFEEFLSNPQPNKPALQNLIKDILKDRSDAKLSKDEILWGAMQNYGKYGPTSPYTHILSKEELEALNPDTLIYLIKHLSTYEHRVLYYGPTAEKKIAGILNALHRTPKVLKPIPAKTAFQEPGTESSRVFVVDYDMKQAEILLLSKDSRFNKEIVPGIKVFNEYFGKGMSSVVFQELRESQALAYSVFSGYNIPKRKDRSHFMVGYIGTQADKLPEALNGLLGLMAKLPESPTLFETAKELVLQTIRSQRTTKSAVLFSYEDAKSLGLDYDIQRDIFDKAQKMTFGEVKKFHEQFVKNKKYTMLVLGKKDLLNMKALEEHGPVRFLTLKDIFGY
jgi:predicted Zn-dependent peptidase